MASKNPLFNLFGYVWRYSFGIKKSFALFVVLSIVGNAIWLTQPLVIGRIFNSIQFAGNQENPVAFIAYNVGLLILITILGWAFHGTSRVIENRNAFLVRKNYRQEMFEKVMDLPTAWHKDHHSGDTIDKIGKAGENLFNFSSELFIIIQNIAKLIGSVAVLIFFDVRLIWIVFFSTGTAIAIILKFDKKLIKNYNKIFKDENFISSGIYDYISNYITIISLRLKKKSAQEIESRSMRPFEIYNKTNTINEIKWFLSSLVSVLMTAGVILFVAYNSYKTNGVIVIGTLFILYQYLDNISGTFFSFAWKYSEIVRQNEAVKAAEIINEEYVKVSAENKYYLPKNWKVLQLKKLNFAYKSEEEGVEKEYAVENISFHIARGEKIAIIGESGSGKSTLLSLLRGLHIPQSASVYCDGKKLPFGLAHLYEHATLIPQEPEMFNNTIEYNITMGVRAKKEDIQRVIRFSNLEKLLTRLKKGLQTNVLEKGVSLSGGEKQRLALARGLLAGRESDFLLLDESTSSVDVENEMQIFQKIFAEFKNKSIISVAHNLHLLKFFDYIYMFKDRRIIAEGSFSEMLNDSDFRSLWENYEKERERTGK